MSPIFYFAIGGRSMLSDLQIALAVGQRHFLVPAGSPMAETLRTYPAPDIHVCLDSGAWPLTNPDRLSLEHYAESIMHWREPHGGWGRLDWAASYDHIGDEPATIHDDQRLRTALHEHGASNAPIVSVRHYPHRLDMPDATMAQSTIPCLAIGGLVPVLAATRTNAIKQQARTWYHTLLNDVHYQRPEAHCHLFGIGQPAMFAHPGIQSFDCSTPARQAQLGWQNIAPTFNPLYGVSAAKLQQSRAARLAYWLIRYRDLAGMDWQACDDSLFAHDTTRRTAYVQHGLFDSLF